MPKQIKQKKNKNYIFIIQITEFCLKIAKYCRILNKRELIDFEFTSLVSGLNDKDLQQKVKLLLVKLGYNNNSVILSLPRHQATCRYIKVPAKTPSEIEKIIPFQASKYLPYPPQELITSYQVVSGDKDGYSYINLNIVHNDLISGYVSLFDSLGIKNFSIVLNSHGLCNLYNESDIKPAFVNMVVDLDGNYVELAIVSQKKLLFSRSVKISVQQNLENILEEEIKKTNSAYLKETGQPAVEKVIIFTNKNILTQGLSEKLSIPIELFNRGEKFYSSDVNEKIKTSDVSIAGLIGLGLKGLGVELNILPLRIKEERSRVFKKKEFIRSAVMVSLAALTLALAITKDLDNKKKYRQKLETELSKISKEAKTLEELERRFGILEAQAKYKLAVLDTIYELYEVMPKDIYLSSFVYEDDNQITMRGQTQELNCVLELVSGLEKSKAFGKFSSKLRYATKKKIQTGDIIDFEIVCAKKK